MSFSLTLCMVGLQELQKVYSNRVPSGGVPNSQKSKPAPLLATAPPLLATAPPSSPWCLCYSMRRRLRSDATYNKYAKSFSSAGNWLSVEPFIRTGISSKISRNKSNQICYTFLGCACIGESNIRREINIIGH